MHRTIGNRFTIYDKMESDGRFSSNPANNYARSPVDGSNIHVKAEYPKMLYHPEGESVVVKPASSPETPLQFREVNEQREMITRVVGSAEEEEQAIVEGWHTHPVKARRAWIEKLISTGQVDERMGQRMIAALPATSAAGRVEELEAEIARLRADRDPNANVLTPAK